ncbi:MAG: hypothetical protein GXP29_06575 [Planctomycetes bacterium]|nr:hypothetical protein [Planctomycetota bacterium]
MIPVNRNPSAKDLRAFALAMVFGFGVIGVVFWYVGPDPNSFSWQSVRLQKVAIGAWIFGALLAGAGFAPRGLAVPVYVAWMSMGMFLGSIMTVVLMSVMFVVLLPIFSLIRLGDPLRLKLHPKGETYWEDYRKYEHTLDRNARPF